MSFAIRTNHHVSSQNSNLEGEIKRESDQKGMDLQYQALTSAEIARRGEILLTRCTLSPKNPLQPGLPTISFAPQDLLKFLSEHPASGTLALDYSSLRNGGAFAVKAPLLSFRKITVECPIDVSKLGTHRRVKVVPDPTPAQHFFPASAEEEQVARTVFLEKQCHKFLTRVLTEFFAKEIFSNPHPTSYSFFDVMENYLHFAYHKNDSKKLIRIIVGVGEQFQLSLPVLQDQLGIYKDTIKVVDSFRVFIYSRKAFCENWEDPEVRKRISPSRSDLQQLLETQLQQVSEKEKEDKNVGEFLRFLNIKETITIEEIVRIIDVIEHIAPYKEVDQSLSLSVSLKLTQLLSENPIDIAFLKATQKLFLALVKCRLLRKTDKELVLTLLMQAYQAHQSNWQSHDFLRMACECLPTVDKWEDKPEEFYEFKLQFMREFSNALPNLLKNLENADNEVTAYRCVLALASLYPLGEFHKQIPEALKRLLDCAIKKGDRITVQQKSCFATFRFKVLATLFAVIKDQEFTIRLFKHLVNEEDYNQRLELVDLRFSKMQLSVDQSRRFFEILSQGASPATLRLLHQLCMQSAENLHEFFPRYIKLMNDLPPSYENIIQFSEFVRDARKFEGESKEAESKERISHLERTKNIREVILPGVYLELFGNAFKFVVHAHKDKLIEKGGNPIFLFKDLIEPARESVRKYRPDQMEFLNTCISLVCLKTIDEETLTIVGNTLLNFEIKNGHIHLTFLKNFFKLSANVELATIANNILKKAIQKGLFNEKKSRQAFFKELGQKSSLDTIEKVRVVYQLSKTYIDTKTEPECKGQHANPDTTISLLQAVSTAFVQLHEYKVLNEIHAMAKGYRLPSWKGHIEKVLENLVIQTSKGDTRERISRFRSMTELLSIYKESHMSPHVSGAMGEFCEGTIALGMEYSDELIYEMCQLLDNFVKKANEIRFFEGEEKTDASKLPFQSELLFPYCTRVKLLSYLTKNEDLEKMLSSFEELLKTQKGVEELGFEYIAFSSINFRMMFERPESSSSQHYLKVIDRYFQTIKSPLMLIKIIIDILTETALLKYMVKHREKKKISNLLLISDPKLDFESEAKEFEAKDTQAQKIFSGVLSSMVLNLNTVFKQPFLHEINLRVFVETMKAFKYRNILSLPTSSFEQVVYAVLNRFIDYLPANYTANDKFLKPFCENLKRTFKMILSDVDLQRFSKIVNDCEMRWLAKCAMFCDQREILQSTLEAIAVLQQELGQTPPVPPRPDPGPGPGPC